MKPDVRKESEEENKRKHGMLYVVATPIGNLSDITKRAAETLSSVDLILAEDTRVTKKLLDHLDIATPLQSYHAHSSERKDEAMLEELVRGKEIALVSDAGTPTISDPGGTLVEAAHAQGVAVVPVPGASAVTTALQVCGLPADRFLFLGFLPHKKGRKTRFEEIAASPYTTVFYESPHRIMKALDSLREVLEEGRTVVVCRELTKMYESIVRGSAPEVLEYFTTHADEVRGEFVVVVSSV